MTQPTDDNANASTLITEEQTRIAAVKEEEIEQRATPCYSTEIPLTRHCFVDTNAVMACNICTYIVDGAILTACCEELLCSKCICSWLSSHSMCPVCTSEMNSASIESPSKVLQRIMSNWTVRCDYYAPAVVGCQVAATLSQLRHHVQNCPHNPSKSETPVRAAMPSSKVDDILSASPSKLRGNIGQRIAIHTVKSNMEEGFAQLQGSRGKPLILTAVASAAVSSDPASPRTISRRKESLGKIEERVRGGMDGARAQQVAGLKRLSKAGQQALLQEAGIKASAPSNGTLLAIKADLNMPWNQLRKLKQWLKQFGLELESEGKARLFIAEHIPTYTAEEVPLA